ncbi:hypothetical protein J3R74_002103 [Puniceicoccus vermicola]
MERLVSPQLQLHLGLGPKEVGHWHLSLKWERNGESHFVGGCEVSGSHLRTLRNGYHRASTIEEGQKFVEVGVPMRLWPEKSRDCIRQAHAGKVLRRTEGDLLPVCNQKKGGSPKRAA